MTREALPEESVFHVARRIASPDARGAYISDACGNDLALRERIVALLERHADDDDLLESPPSGKVDGAAAQPSAPTPSMPIIRTSRAVPTLIRLQLN